MDKLLAILKELIERHFYGKVEVTLENGKVVNIKKTESIKP